MLRNAIWPNDSAHREIVGCIKSTQLLSVEGRIRKSVLLNELKQRALAPWMVQLSPVRREEDTRISNYFIITNKIIKSERRENSGHADTPKAEKGEGGQMRSHRCIQNQNIHF